jgi:UDP-glucose 4-epimerase
MNVGTGRGTSVRKVINLVCTAAGKSEVVATELEHRAGDPAALFADVSLAAQVLGFTSEYSLEESIDSLF